jgi:eukaryotic-like serine/threonine-protein kinase
MAFIDTPHCGGMHRMPPDQETINAQFQHLAEHRQRLVLLLQQLAKFGVYTPPYVIIDIRAAQNAIRRIKDQLRAAGVPVDDQPDDEAHPATGQPGPQRAAGLPIKQRLQTAIGLLLLTVLIGVLTNIATGNAWGEYTPLAWALLVLCVGGAIVLTVRQVHLERESSISAAVADTNRSRMLARVEASWVKGVLEQSLYQVARIELGLEYNPKAVAHPWESMVQRPNQPNQVLPGGKAAIEVFDQLGQELLILGAPGAGKTTLVLELTRDLIARARQDAQHPVPVVFNLSTWATKRLSLDKWLVEELDKQYDVPPTLAQEWVTANTILPLLDGLDEVAAAQRDACVEAINVYRRERGLVPLVVCSRVEEYGALTGKLRLTGAIVIQPLMAQQLDAYLKPKALAGVRTLLRDDPTLGELLDTPLMLSIMVLTYKEKSPAKLRASGTLEERRRRLFDDYIEAMFERRSREMRYPRVHTIHWLAWLARALSRQAQTVFLIERLQPEWLPAPAARRRYVLVDRLVGGLAFGLVSGLVFALISGLGGTPTPPLLNGLGDGLMFGLIVGFFGGRRETPSGAQRGIGRLLRSAILGYLVIGLGSFLAAALVLGLGGESVRSEVRRAAVAAAAGGLAGQWGVDRVVNILLRSTGALIVLVAFLGLIAYGAYGALIGALVGRPGVQPRRITVIETLRWSWPKARQSALGGMVSGLVSGLSLGLVGGLGSVLVVFPVVVPDAGLGVRLVFGLAFGLAFGVVFGLASGVVFGLAFGVGGGLTGGEVEAKAIPNQGIRRSARSALLSGLIVGGIFGLGNEMLFGLLAGLGAELASSLVAGLEFGLVGALAYGGYACLSHLALRLVLWRSGALPWNITRFLDYCADRIFLRKVGGGYIFVHRLLLEYFAALEPVQPARALDAG